MTLKFGTAIVKTLKDGTQRILDFDIENSYEEAAELVDHNNATLNLPEYIRYAVASIQLADSTEETEA